MNIRRADYGKSAKDLTDVELFTRLADYEQELSTDEEILARFGEPNLFGLAVALNELYQEIKQRGMN